MCRCIKIEGHHGTEVEYQRVGNELTDDTRTTGEDGGIIVGLYRFLKPSTVTDERGVSVEPESAVLQHAIKDECSCPHIGVAAIGMGSLRHDERSVALLHQTHGSGKCATGECVCIGGSDDIGIAASSLHPCRCVVGEDIRSGTVGHCHRHVVGLTDQQVFVVAFAADSSVVNHLHTIAIHEWRWGDGNALQFTKEVAHMRWLVISVHLCDHRIAILMVVPEGIVAPVGRDGGGIDTYVVVVGAHHHLLAPVAEEVGLQTGRCLGVVVGQRTREVGNDTASIFDNDTLRVIASRTVERLLAEVAVPVDAEVLGDMVLRALGEPTVGDGTDEVGVAGRNALTAGELVGEVAHDGTSVVIASREPVENLAGGGITEVVAGVVFVASEELLSVAVGVEVAHMLRIAVSQSSGS